MLSLFSAPLTTCSLTPAAPTPQLRGFPTSLCLAPSYLCFPLCLFAVFRSTFWGISCFFAYHGHSLRPWLAFILINYKSSELHWKLHWLPHTPASNLGVCRPPQLVWLGWTFLILSDSGWPSWAGIMAMAKNPCTTLSKCPLLWVLLMQSSRQLT